MRAKEAAVLNSFLPWLLRRAPGHVEIPGFFVRLVLSLRASYPPDQRPAESPQARLLFITGHLFPLGLAASHGCSGKIPGP